MGITAGFAICEDQGKNLYPGDQDHMSHIKIPVSTLRPGMYIVDPGISWLKAPLLYMQEGILASDDEINGIILQGFAEAYYDPERSRDENSAAPQPNTPLAIELHNALKKPKPTTAQIKCV